METNTPETLMEAVAYFSQADTAHNFMVELRWPNGVSCPRCQSTRVCAIATRKTWECKDCTAKKQFSVKTGTIFEESPLPMAKWLATIWLIANAKNGISSYEVSRAIGVSQKSAWFMLHRVRTAMRTGSFDKLKGDVEVDETFIGGKARNMHPERRKRLGKGTGGIGKTVVMGFLERGGNVRAFPVRAQSRATIDPTVREHVEPGSHVFTDELSSYDQLKSEYVHDVIRHAESYVNGQIHTNGIENFWSCLKRTLKGTYVSVDPAHLFRYLDEQVNRFNNRKMTDSERFVTILRAVTGKRLTWNELTNAIPA
jgi:transposase-like protein